MNFREGKEMVQHKFPLLIADAETFQLKQVNEEFKRHFGFEKEQVEATSIEELFSEKVIQQVRQMHPGMMIPLVSIDQAYFYPRPEEERPVKLDAFLQTDKKPSLLVKIEPLDGKHDIRQKIELFDHLLYHFPDTIYFKDRQSRFVLVNQKQADILGIDNSKEAVGKTDFDFFPREEAKDSYEDEQHILETGRPITNKREKVTNEDGNIFWVSTTKVPLRNDEDEIIGTMGITRDITGRKKLEDKNRKLLKQEQEMRQEAERSRRKLQVQKNQFQGAFEKAAIGMALVSVEGKFKRVNQSLCSMLGYEREELLALTFQEITHGEDLDKDLDRLNQLLAGERESYTIEKRYYKKSGEIIWAILNVSLVRNPEGQPVHFVSQIQDITDRKAYERQINQSLEEKRVMLEEIHHRVKNNLASISGILELQSYNIENEQVKEVLSDAQSRIQTMALVHEQLYEHDTLSNIDMDKYVRGLVDTIQDSLTSEEKQIDVHVNTDDISLNLNQAVPCGLILNELITNAFKHGFEGQEEGNVWIDVSEKQDDVEICVMDDGVGLPADFSLENRDTLGINLVNTLIEQLEAEISYESDGGAKFSICFSIN